MGIIVLVPFSTRTYDPASVILVSVGLAV